MTPSELLEEVKGRFVVLYHDAPEALDRLLRQAMAKFQDIGRSLAGGMVRDTGYPFAGPLQICRDML